MISLTKHTKFSGCGAKLAPNVLQKALCGLSQPLFPNVIANYSGCEDAGLYQISSDKILVQTVDFFPPIVDDPFLFGRIASANALSDVYAMGGKPLTALALVCFPVKEFGLDNLKSMMEGGLSALTEAGCALIGGHSIEDSEPKLGYAITGEVKDGEYWRNNSISENCSLILTKPIGTGLINMAFRAECVSSIALDEAQKSMSYLNKEACEILQNYKISACTDVTGFGLLGHMAEMVSDTKYGITLFAKEVPLFSDVFEYASMGLVPEGAFRNKEGRGKYVENLENINPVMRDILFDPQTSGGLLAAVKKEDADKILLDMKNKNINAKIIGETNKQAGVIRVVL